MSRNDTIGIVGIITGEPQLVINASDWKQRVYETKLMRRRPSGTEDVFILQFDGHSAGTKETLKKIADGVEVLICGEIRSENVHNQNPGENRVKLFVYAEIVAVNDPPADQQNEVNICGNICRAPRLRHRKRGVRDIAITSIVVAAKGQTGVHYIPCVCWGKHAEMVAQLEVGTYVELIGRFQSRRFCKNIKGHSIPYLMTAYEISATDIKFQNKKGEKP